MGLMLRLAHYWKLDEMAVGAAIGRQDRAIAIGGEKRDEKAVIAV